MARNNAESQRNSVMLQFPRKRGRPKSAHKGVDIGTPELVMKRQAGTTAETLDLCLTRGLINAQQHWCGIHLRWLYSLRHGAPGIKAIDLTHSSGISVKLDDPHWRAEREKEYHQAVKALAASGHALLLTNICVYDERPPFLNGIRAGSKESVDTITRLCAGLDVLVSLWRRG